MDIVVAIGNYESSSQPFEKIERKSQKTTFLDSIGAHEIFSSEVNLTYQCVYRMPKYSQ